MAGPRLVFLITAALVCGLGLTPHARVIVAAAGDEAPTLVSGRSPAASHRFRYDETTGKCLDAEGREGYNRSSRQELETTGDAECADFRRAFNLTYLYLDKANLRGANFAGTPWYLGSITDSDLTGADLSNTSGQMDYRRSRLRGANLLRADLTYGDLTDTDLAGANLRGARFSVKTRLPFDRDEAQRRGMILVATP
jgi:hypothetical protein